MDKAVHGSGCRNGGGVASVLEPQRAVAEVMHVVLVFPVGRLVILVVIVVRNPHLPLSGAFMVAFAVVVVVVVQNTRTPGEDGLVVEGAHRLLLQSRKRPGPALAIQERGVHAKQPQKRVGPVLRPRRLPPRRPRHALRYSRSKYRSPHVLPTRRAHGRAISSRQRARTTRR